MNSIELIESIMKQMNRLYRAKVDQINKSDVEFLFGSRTDLIRSLFDYLDIEYTKVADIWNVKVRYFTREEQNKQILYANIIFA